MENEPSARVIDQRIRNRIMETIQILAEGDKGVREVGASSFFNYFFDWIPDDFGTFRNSALSVEEHEQLAALCQIVNEACNDAPKMIDEDYLIETGWPERIARKAERTLQTFLIRGWFDEENEEVKPSKIRP